MSNKGCVFRPMVMLLILACSGCSPTQNGSTPPALAVHKEHLRFSHKDYDYENWIEYSPEEPFVMRLPSEPIEKKTQSDGRTIIVAASSLVMKKSNRIGIIFQSLQRPITNSRDRDYFYQGYAEAFKSEFEGKILSESIIRSDYIGGREYMIKRMNGNYVRSRVFLTKMRVIELQVMGPDDSSIMSQEADKFLSSIYLKDDKNNQ